MALFPRGYPVSTDGLNPTRRCQDLRRRAMLSRRQHPINRLAVRKLENMIYALHNRTFTSGGGWNGETGDGDIFVHQVGGGWHRDCTAREYTIRAGYVISIRRSSG